VPGRSEPSCDLTHKIATPGSISLPLFTRNQSPKICELGTEWKHNFAASKFWNHNLAEKILGLCTQNVLPDHGFSLQKELQASLNPVT
jgi:hypothetical protein